MASHYEVARRWAERSDPQGRMRRDLRGHHMWMDGDTIYSYGRHFYIAQWITLPSGERVAMFNPESYSVSTSKHQSITRRAFSQWGGRAQTFTCPRGYLAPENVAWYDDKIAEYGAKASRARTYGPHWLSMAEQTSEERDRYIHVLAQLREAA